MCSQWGKKEFPSITEAELACKFTMGSGIHGVNYKRAFFERTWEQQQSDFAWILLNSIFPIYEEWLLELKNTIFPDMKTKEMQFPNQIRNEVSRLTSNSSNVLSKAFYTTFCNKRDRNYAHIEELMKCYRVFKEARNCFMHHGSNATQKLIDAHLDYTSSASERVLSVKEIPFFSVPKLDEKISLSLRGAVGFSYVLIKILVSLDTELLCSVEAEKELISRFKQQHPTRRTLKSDIEGSKRQIKHYIMQCSFPEPQSVDEVRQFLLEKHLVSK